MDKKLLSLMSLFILTFGVFAGVVVFNKPLTQLTRAKEEAIPSLKNSLVFAWPLELDADGTTASTITVFIRTDLSKPLTGKPVTLTSTLGAVKEQSVTTDAEGRAVFTLTSAEKGIAELQAFIDNTSPLERKISVKFK